MTFVKRVRLLVLKSMLLGIGCLAEGPESTAVVPIEVNDKEPHES